MFPDNLLPVFDRTDVIFEQGEGAWLTASDGRRFLDFGAGVAVNALGHAHPRLVAALEAQAGKLWHCSNLYRVPGQERVAERLIKASFADTAFFCNTGAEAMELVIKIARRYHHCAGRPERNRIVACTGSFHGRTIATLAAAGTPKYLEGFGPVAQGFDHVPYGDLEAARGAIGSNTAALLVEPVQGEGGIRPADPAYLRGLRALADQFGLLLLMDEVQTGIGRTGKLFAHEWSGIAPDVMGLAKGLGGGFPVGAVLATEKAASCMTPGTHGCTFGGNPLAMAVAEAVLDEVMAPGFLERVQAVAALLRGRLDDLARRYPGAIAQVRGQGLMLGLKTVPVNTEFNAKLFAAGLLAVGAGDNVVRLVPPLIIGEAEVERAVEIIDGVCRG
ncbi:aspartate aminotransferase family protein [Paramagnetospirillum magneticum]|uniref:Acetylornithine aminotransferase n=1 Tax=Paramagnetospirillum magneticum (strain ATCC 700264 / AMB-1) TaxID=342108 RepID=Q2W959_PARM1|nr:aspartate aminotransferase family protein [Paramagnetospirillum magneticum]BAE49616.1 Ornithine/acetylornithine aminotransferase [Paramagnetospirillum magneticum AMB-1]